MSLLKRTKVCVFGSNGFIGKNLLYILSKSYDICVFVRSPILENDYNIFKSTKVYVNQFSLENLIKFLQNESPDFVINLISYVSADRYKQDSNLIIQSNFLTVDLILKAMTLSKIKVKQFIQFGSTEEYGNSKAPFKEEVLPNTNSIYGLSKLMATNLVQMYSKEYNIPSIILRPSNVFGDNQSKEKIIPYIISSINKGEHFKISNPEKLREFYSVLDLIYSLKIIMSFDQPKFGEIYNVGYGKGIKILDMILLIEKVIGTKAIFSIDNKLERINEPIESFVSVEKFKKDFQMFPFESNFENRLIQFLSPLKQ